MLDFINCSFEFLASLAILNHCRTLIKDKQVKGISILSIVFFTMWGAWNIYYYPSLGQTLSFYAGILVFLVNLYYIYLLFKYQRN